MSQASIDPNDFKATQRIAWGAAAAGWRKWWRVFEAAAQPLNERIVDLAGVKPGDKVLDVASGIGEPALTAAKRTGPTGRVLATDLAAPMLEVARERALALHLENVEFREMDAEKLDGAAASFDAATCRWAVMLVLDPVAVCRGVRRALKPGARFATSVWCEAPRVPFLAIRGISDIVGFKRDPGWTAYACHSAAAFTRAFLCARPLAPPATPPVSRTSTTA